MTFARTKRFDYLTCFPPRRGRIPSSPSPSLSSSPEKPTSELRNSGSRFRDTDLDRQARSV